jgi:crotonobetainyl-CoA:carnitine CoA-transferase CaiB-like acyl-CoA transferase
MIKDPRFADNSARLAHAEAAERPVAEFIARHDCAECLAIFEKAEVAPIYDIDQFVADPHVGARQIVIDVPDEVIGRVTVHNVIPRLSATPGALRRPAPKLGEHTGAVLALIGIDAGKPAALRDEGIV